MKKFLLFCLIFYCLTISAQNEKPYYTPVAKGQIWTVNTGGYTSSFPQKDGNFVYVGRESGKVICIDLKDGKQQWEYFLSPNKNKVKGLEVIHRIVGDENNIYFNDCANTVYALDKKTGTLKWSYFRSPVKKNSQSEILVKCAFDDDLMTYGFIFKDDFIINTASSIIAINKTTGKLSWEVKSESEIGNMSFDKNIIYYSTRDGILYAIDPTSQGKKLYQFPVLKSSMNFQLLIQNDYAYMTYGNPKRDSIVPVTCYDLKEKKEKWTKKKQSGLLHSNGQFLYLASSEALTAFDLATGDEKWSVIGDYSWYTSPYFFNDCLYIHNRTKRMVYGFDCKTGEKKKEYDLNDKTYTVPIITNEYMYFGEAKEYKCIKIE